MCQHQIAVHNDGETQIIATHDEVTVKKNGLKIEIPMETFIDFMGELEKAAQIEKSIYKITEIHIHIDGKEDE